MPVKFNTRDKIKIKCYKHGLYEQKANKHLIGRGCHICGGKKTTTTSDFILSAKNIHGEKYDYSNVIYFNTVTKIPIICKKHGIFYQTPHHHIDRKQGCDKCRLDRMSEKFRTPYEVFLNRANEIHKDKYIYPELIYKNSTEKIKIICPLHGIFTQRVIIHLLGCGCTKCSTVSKGEDAIRKFLKYKNIDYIEQYSIENYNRFKYDFYLPEYNLLIEYDGKQHFNKSSWGGEVELINIQKRDSVKNELAIKNNYKLLRISYKEYNQIKDKIMDKINNVVKDYTAIVYCDGSTGPGNPSFYGSGAHGYLFSSENIGKKSADRPKNNIITTLGYIESELIPKYKDLYEVVVPEMYIDGIYSYRGISTNNVAELNACIESFHKLFELKQSDEGYNITHIIFKTDSMYLINIENAIIKSDAWKENTERVNFSYWLKIYEVIEKAKELGITYKIVKVVGHSGDHGNHISDRLALLARMESTRLSNEIIFKLSTPKNYWTGTPDRHPFLSLRQLFFTNIQREESKENIFAVMKYKKDDELGKKSHEACFGLVIFNNKIELLESAITEFQKHLKTMSLLSSVDLNNLYSNNVNRYLDIFGTKAFMFNKNQGILNVVDETDVVNEIRPAGLATQAFNKVLNLYTLIGYYRTGDTDLIKTFDITDKFYELDEKNKTKTVIPNGVNSIEVEFTYEDSIIKLPLELGRDLLDRNAIKKLESPDVKVTLMVEKITPLYLQYFIIIDKQDTNDISIWHNFYSNSILIKAIKKGK